MENVLFNAEIVMEFKFIRHSVLFRGEKVQNGINLNLNLSWQGLAQVIRRIEAVVKVSHPFIQIHSLLQLFLRKLVQGR